MTKQPSKPLTTQTQQALAVYDKIDDPLAFVKAMAMPACAMMGCSVQQGPAVALAMLCEGLNPVQYAKRYHWIDGGPSMKADAMLAEFRMNHGGEYEVIKREPEGCEIHFTDRRGKTYECAFTWEEAQQAPWPYKKWDQETNRPASEMFKYNWATPIQRRSMLFARCVSDSLRFICPELVAGVYTPEELFDAKEDRGATTVSATVVASKVLASDAVTPTSMDDSAVDADYTPTPANDSQSSDNPSDSQAATSVGLDIPGAAFANTREAILGLYEELKVPQEKQQEALAKRKVQSLHGLSENQAREILGRLQDRQRQLAASGNE